MVYDKINQLWRKCHRMFVLSEKDSTFVSANGRIDFLRTTKLTQCEIVHCDQNGA